MASDDEFENGYEDEALPRRRLRLIPLTVIMLSLLLVIKVNEVYIGSRQLRELYSVREAKATEEKSTETAAAETPKADPSAEKKEAAEAKKDDAAPAAEAKPGETKPAADSKSADAAPDAKPSDAKPADSKADSKTDGKTAEAKPADATADAKPAEAKDKKDAADKKDGDKKDADKKEGDKAAKVPEEPKTYGTGKSTVKQIEALKAKDATPRFSQSEVDLLENLSKRRDELDQREKELTIKSKVLDATQKRIDDKIAEMKTLETQLAKTVALYNEKQNAQIASLVKIYETMKPTQAAAIFNELDLPILLEVIDKMSERKVAPVLALMDPKKARDVTQELAAMRKSAPKVPAAVGGAKP